MAPAGAATSVLLAAPARNKPLVTFEMLKAKSTLQWAEFKTRLAFLTLAVDMGAMDWMRRKQG